MTTLRALALASLLPIAFSCPGADGPADGAGSEKTGDPAAIQPDGGADRGSGVHAGLVVHASQRDFTTTAAAVDSALASRGLNVFAVVDHAAGARGAGLELPPTKVWIFGNPKAGTPLMHASPTVAIDLPQKILVWEDGPAVRIAYNDPAWIARRHGIDPALPQIEGIAGALEAITREAAGLDEEGEAP